MRHCTGHKKVLRSVKRYTFTSIYSIDRSIDKETNSAVNFIINLVMTYDQEKIETLIHRKKDYRTSLLQYTPKSAHHDISIYYVNHINSS